jgi:SET domain-containing protein
MIRRSIPTPNKLRLLNNLAFDCYCSFGISEIDGIGVIAIRDIAKDINPFIVPNKSIGTDIVELTEEEMDELPKETAEKLRGLFIKCKGKYPIHHFGLNGVGAPFWMNHSDEPNIGLDYDFGIVGPARVANLTLYCPFLTLREINKGEELTWDYRTCNEADDLEKQFPFLKKPGVMGKLWNKLKGE